MNKEFAQKVFDAAKETGFSPAFVTAMTCIETGWGRNSQKKRLVKRTGEYG